MARIVPLYSVRQVEHKLRRTMKINIRSLSFQANEKLVDFAEDKISKLGLYSESIIDAQISLRIDKSDTRDNKVCVIKLSIPGNDLFASKKGQSFEEAILKTSEALRQQLLTWKEKNQKAIAKPEHGLGYP